MEKGKKKRRKEILKSYTNNKGKEDKIHKPDQFLRATVHLRGGCEAT